MERLPVEDVESNKFRGTKTRKDDTKVSREMVSSEKITVSRRDVTRADKTEKLKYPMELDIGRIVIEEIPEKEGEMSKLEVSQKDKAKPRRVGLTVMQDKVEEVPRTYGKEDVIKVGKSDKTEMGKVPVEPRKLEGRVTTYTDRVDGASMVVYMIYLSIFGI